MVSIGNSLRSGSLVRRCWRRSLASGLALLLFVSAPGSVFAEERARATGMGGFFFRAEDEKALKAWYMKHLGVGWSNGVPWMQEAGPTVFEAFAADTDYFPADRRFMVNFRVDDLARLIKQLEAEGIEVIQKEEWKSEVGVFARIHDPEGNPIELWEPRLPAED